MALRQREQQPLTVEAFEALLRLPQNRDRKLELVEGELVEKMPTEEHGWIVAVLTTLLMNFVRERKIGRVLVETRYRSADDPHNSRIPDVSFRQSNEPLVTQGAVMQYPDLAVEVQSPADTVKAMREKARFYLANGSKLVWLVFPSQRIIEVYSVEVEAILTEHDTLSGGDLLPDFSVPVRDLFTESGAADA